MNTLEGRRFHKSFEGVQKTGRNRKDAGKISFFFSFFSSLFCILYFLFSFVTQDLRPSSTAVTVVNEHQKMQREFFFQRNHENTPRELAIGTDTQQKKGKKLLYSTAVPLGTREVNRVKLLFVPRARFRAKSKLDASRDCRKRGGGGKSFVLCVQAEN